MSLTLFIHGGATPSAVQFLPNNFFNKKIGGGPVYSGVKFDSDGNIYERNEDGGWSSIGAWRLSGASSGFYINRVISKGALNTDDGGTAAVPLVLSTDRIYSLKRSDVGIDTATVNFEISTDNPATVIVASITYSFRAILEDGVEDVAPRFRVDIADS